MVKKISAFSLALVLVFCLAAGVAAHEVPDLTRTGSITIRIEDGGDGVSGGSVTLYYVAEITEDDGNYAFALTAEYAPSGVSLDHLNDASTAKSLAEFARNNQMQGMTAEVDAYGVVQFTGLQPGLYLVVQHEAASGYYPIAPFLMSLPLYENGTYTYEVDASPKVQIQRAPEPTVPETTPDEPKLPQTGQLNWPVPVLAVSGLTLFILGWALCFGKKENYEK